MGGNTAAAIAEPDAAQEQVHLLPDCSDITYVPASVATSGAIGPISAVSPDTRSASSFGLDPLTEARTAGRSCV
eukprot:scaffold34530_cov129-Isochrysis_galbana.AAC.4